MANDQFRNALAEYRKVAQKGLDDQRDKVLAIANDQESAAYKKFNDERDKIDLLAEILIKEAHKRLDERLEEIEAEIKVSMENAKASIYEAATVVGEKAFETWEKNWEFKVGDEMVNKDNGFLYRVEWVGQTEMRLKRCSLWWDESDSIWDLDKVQSHFNNYKRGTK
jgi:nitrogen regulatory protein PII-like uncharacterized protein